MTSPMLVGLKRIVFATGIIVAALASASGVIDAVRWATHLFGTVPVAIAGAFVAGAIVMHGIDYALVMRRRGGATTR